LAYLCFDGINEVASKRKEQAMMIQSIAESKRRPPANRAGDADRGTRISSRPDALSLQLAISQKGRRCSMQCDNYFEEDGIRLGYTADTVTITEIGYGRKAVLDNEGTILSSTFPNDSLDFVHRYFRENYDMIESAREIDRQYGHD
jgi:hypothetical protein